MRQQLTRLANTGLLIALLTATGFTAGGRGQECTIGIERTAQRGRVLYDDNPKPVPFLPLIVSEVNPIGAISEGQQLTICRRVDRSTWNERSAWLHVRVDRNTADAQSGWIRMSREEANSWIEER